MYVENVPHKRYFLVSDEEALLTGREGSINLHVKKCAQSYINKGCAHEDRKRFPAFSYR